MQVNIVNEFYVFMIDISMICIEFIICFVFLC